MKKKQNQETYDVIIPLEFVTRIKVTNDFPNKRSKVQRQAGDELRRFLGDDLYLDDSIKLGRTHSRRVQETKS